MKAITLPGLMDVVAGDKENTRATYLGNALAQFVFRRGIPLEVPTPAYAVKVLVGPRHRLAYDDPKGETVYRAAGETPLVYSLTVRLDLKALGLGRNDYVVRIERPGELYTFNFTVITGESTFSPGDEM